MTVSLKKMTEHLKKMTDGSEKEVVWESKIGQVFVFRKSKKETAIFRLKFHIEIS